MIFICKLQRILDRNDTQTSQRLGDLSKSQVDLILLPILNHNRSH